MRFGHELELMSNGVVIYPLSIMNLGACPGAAKSSGKMVKGVVKCFGQCIALVINVL